MSDEHYISDLYTKIGERIQAARKHAKLSQTDLSDRLGLTRTSTSNFETGKQRVQIDTLYCIASILCIDVHELLPEMSDLGRIIELQRIREQIELLQQRADELREGGTP